MADELDAETLAFAHRMFDLARSGEAQLLEYVDAGLPVDLTTSSGDTLLLLSAYHDNVDLVAGLLARGADTGRQNDRGQTPLVAATFRRSVATVTALLDAGADPTAGAPNAVDTARFFEAVEVLPLLQAAAEARR